MNLIRFCTRRPVFTWVTVILAALLGLYGYFKLGVALYPKVDIPVIVISASYRGASPAEIESLVSKPLEDAVSEVDGVDKIESYSIEGVSFVVAEMKLDVNLSEAVVDVSNRIKAARSKLPSEVDDPVVEKVDINAEPFMVAVFTTDMDGKKARDILDDRVKRRLTRVEGIAQVALVGGEEREIHVLLNPVAIRNFNLSPVLVSSIVAANNLTNPAGYIAQGNREITLRYKGEAPDVRALGEIQIPLGDGASVRLGDVARIEDGAKDLREFARFDGKPAFQLQIKARPNANIVEVGAGVRKELEKILPTLPKGFRLDIPYDNSKFVSNSVRNVIRDMITGTLLTALVLYLFLRRLSATAVVSIAMPTAVLATFIPMMIQGYTLNMMSTLGLALSMGVLVNNSILVLENITRFRDMGYEPVEAAERGTAEIALSVLATTGTNLGVFLPVAFLPGVAGQFLVQYAMVIVYATLFSLWVSLTLTPMLAARMPQAPPTPLSCRLCGWWEWLYEGLENLHHRLVAAAVGSPWRTLGITAVVLVVVFALTPRLGSEFFPRVDEGVVGINVELPAESSLARTERAVRRIEDFVLKQPHVKNVVVSVGGAGARTGVNLGSVEAYLDDDPKRPSTFEFANRIRPFLAALPDTTLSVQAAKTSFSRGQPLQVVVTGEDTVVLNRVAGEVMKVMRSVQGVVDVDRDWRVGRPELAMDPIRWRMGRLGADAASVSSNIRGYVTGLEAGKYREGGLEYDILVKMEPERTKSVFGAPDLPVMTSAGSVPLKDVTRFSYEAGPTRIVRKDRIRSVTVEADVVGRTVGEAFQEIRSGLKELSVPPGYAVKYEGDVEAMQETFRDMGVAFGLAVAITFLMVAAILESWAFAFIIILTVPLSAIGVIPAMVATNTAVSLYALMGLVMLVGLVVNNAIVIVDFAEGLRRSGSKAEEAIIEACRVRFRSILMADLTSIFAMIPLALGMGEGGALRAPMAIVAIGGLLAGGGLALFVIPPVYRLFWERREGKPAQPRRSWRDLLSAAFGRIRG